MRLKEGIFEGDSFKLLKRLPAESVRLVLADPPYNVSQENNLQTMGRRGIEFSWDGGFDQVGWLKAATDALMPGGSIVIFNDWKNLGQISEALRILGLSVKRQLHWYKCLAGSTEVYAKHFVSGKVGPISIKDLGRVVGKTPIDVWTGSKWARILSASVNNNPKAPLEITLKSGEVLKSTSNHKWPTAAGIVEASNLKPGDVLRYSTTPNSNAAAGLLDDDLIGWFIGLYIAEGSRSRGKIQIASHIKEKARFDKLQRLATAYHSKANIYCLGATGASIVISSKILNAILDTYISGKLSYGKHLSRKTYSRNNAFLKAILLGYLDGNGHYKSSNDRWRLRVTGKNKYLAKDLRAICARLDLPIRLVKSKGSGFGKDFPTYFGSLRLTRATGNRARVDTEIVSINPCRWSGKFWDISIDDDDHLFTLASGVMTHNSNPIPRNMKRVPVQRMEYALWAVKSGAPWVFNKDGAPTTLKSCCKPYLARSDKYCGMCGRRVMAKGYEDGIFYHATQKDILHETKKPNGLWADIIKVFSNEGEWVVDPFAGAGTLAVAATSTGRRHMSFDSDWMHVMWANHLWRKEQTKALVTV